MNAVVFILAASMLISGSRAFGSENPAPLTVPLSICDTGAVGDGKILNTRAIQNAIDKLAGNGGGTVVVPTGCFLTGAVFLKPKVNLYLEKGAVLLGSTRIEDYPSMPTRIEGHTCVWRPALVNASRCDGLHISGE